MMAMLKGKPLMSLAGFLRTENRKLSTLSPRVSLKIAINTVPTNVVVIQVITNRATFIHGNGRTDSSAKNSAGGVKLLSMKLLRTKNLDAGLKRLQVLAGLEPHGFTGRDIHFGTGSRVAADSRLARLDREDAK